MPNVSFCRCLSGGTTRCLSELDPMFLSVNICLMDSICVCLNRFPTLLSANVCLEGPFDVYLNQTKCYFSASVCLMDSICVCLNWSPMFLSANICLKGPVGVYLDHPNISFCNCLSDWFDRCLSELVPTVSFLSMSAWTGSDRFFSASVCLEEPVDVCLD